MIRKYAREELEKIVIDLAIKHGIEKDIVIKEKGGVKEKYVTELKTNGTDDIYLTISQYNFPPAVHIDFYEEAGKKNNLDLAKISDELAQNLENKYSWMTVYIEKH